MRRGRGIHAALDLGEALDPGGQLLLAAEDDHQKKIVGSDIGHQVVQSFEAIADDILSLIDN